jgi:hypothetical protein
VSTDGFHSRSIRRQSTTVPTSPSGIDGATASVARVVVVVGGGTVVVVAQESVVAATGALSAEALPALSTAETAYELVLEPDRPVSDVAVAGASTCRRKPPLR